MFYLKKLCLFQLDTVFVKQHTHAYNIKKSWGNMTCSLNIIIVNLIDHKSFTKNHQRIRLCAKSDTSLDSSFGCLASFKAVRFQVRFFRTCPKLKKMKWVIISNWKIFEQARVFVLLFSLDIKKSVVLLVNNE